MKNPSYSQDYFSTQSTSCEEDVYIQSLIHELVSATKKSNDAKGIEIDQLLDAFTLNNATDLFIDLKLLDQQTNINDYLKQLNKTLQERTIKKVIGVVYTLENWRRDKKILRIPILRKPASWYFFIVNRVLPKIAFLNKIRVISKKRLFSNAEILGRFCYNGFEIEKFIHSENNFHIFVVSRKENPLIQPIQNGFFIKLPRIGKNGKEIQVYKLRTMHTYAEYLHSYMIGKHGFNQNGKIKNDFRLAGWGRSLRKFWIDELPQLINILKGEMKLVGVRPVSKAYFNSLPTANQHLRLKQKPGCIPPYVALNIGTSKEAVLKAEMIYLAEKAKNPYFTDTKYLFIALYNIIFKGLRSS